MINEWEEQLNDRQRIGQYLAVNHAGNAKPCPTCRQLNAKVSELGFAAAITVVFMGFSLLL